jgi:hypothetical protein
MISLMVNLEFGPKEKVNLVFQAFMKLEDLLAEFSKRRKHYFQ